MNMRDLFMAVPMAQLPSESVEVNCTNGSAQMRSMESVTHKVYFDGPAQDLADIADSVAVAQHGCGLHTLNQFVIGNPPGCGALLQKVYAARVKLSFV